MPQQQITCPSCFQTFAVDHQLRVTREPAAGRRTEKAGPDARYAGQSPRSMCRVIRFFQRVPDGADEQASDYYAAFLRYAATENFKPVSLPIFGKLLRMIGAEPRRSATRRTLLKPAGWSLEEKYQIVLDRVLEENRIEQECYDRELQSLRASQVVVSDEEADQIAELQTNGER